MSFQVSVVVTLMALAVLAVFWIGAAPHFDLARWATPYFPPAAGKLRAGVVRAALRAVALSGHRAASAGRRRESTPERDMPRGILSGLVTLIAISFLTVVLSAGIAPGAAKVARIERAAVSGLSDDFRRRNRDARTRAARLHRADRQLSHHHLRLRPADLFAVARGLFSDLAFGDSRHGARRRSAR